MKWIDTYCIEDSNDLTWWGKVEVKEFEVALSNSTHQTYLNEAKHICEGIYVIGAGNFSRIGICIHTRHE